MKQLVTHVRKFHPSSSMKSFKSKVTAENFNANEPVKCPVCPYYAADFRQFVDHILKKHENYKFHCYLCIQYFEKVNDLKWHMKYKHEDKMPFSCEVCQVTFSCHNPFIKVA